MSVRQLRSTTRASPSSISLHSQASPAFSNRSHHHVDEEDASDQDEKENIDPLTEVSDAAAATAAPQPQQRRKRGKYHHRLTDESRSEIARLHVSEGKTAAEIVRILNVNGIMTTLKTVESVIKVLRTEGRVQTKPAPHHQSKYTAEEEQQLISIQQQHNDFTYSQLRAEWQQLTNSTKPLTNGTIHTMLNRNRISTKNLVPVPQARNTPEAIEERKTYCEEAIAWDRPVLIFIDETGFDKHLHRKRGRNTIGKIATYSQITSAGCRLNVCAAVSPIYGLIMYRVLLSSWDQQQFSHFINDLLGQPLVKDSSHFLVMDRVKWHHTELIRDVLEGQRVQHEIKLLPPYSPHLNPIEYCFHIWKTEIKNTVQTESSNLRAQIDAASRCITPELVSNCLDHVYQYYVHCISKKPLEEFVPYKPPRKPLVRIAS